MMMAIEAAATHMGQALANVPFEGIDSPGCYVCKTTGALVRMPQEGLATGGSPVIEIVSKKGPVMMKISDDPWIPISRARQLSADADLHPDF
jgi:hypothetical protein